MGVRKLVLLGFALAMAACGEVDPLAAARAACANAESETEAQISACTTLIESGELGQSERAIALANRGSARVVAGDITQALRDFEAALAADDQNMHAIMGRASILIDSGQVDAAQPLVERLVASGAYRDNAHFLAGRIAAQRGDIAAALGAYDAAIAANPRFAPALANRAGLKQTQQDYPGALADYDAAIAINPRLSPALAGRCWTRVLQEDGDIPRARADGDAAVSYDPRNVNGQLCRGLLQLRASDWAGAQESYEAALEVEPGNPAALFGRGVARRRAGDGAGREDMNQARDFDRHIAQRFDDLGVRSY